jgi:addiction module RelE/StbE family toxin
VRIELTKDFEKQFKKLRRNEQIRVVECLRVFERYPETLTLRRHALKGKYKRFMSISAGGDLRLHYYEKDDSITCVFVSAGSHSQLYK